MSGKFKTIGDFAVFRPSQVLSGTNREKRMSFYFSYLPPTILDYRGCLRFMVAKLRNPRSSGISRHMKTRLTDFEFGIL